MHRPFFRVRIIGFAILFAVFALLIFYGVNPAWAADNDGKTADAPEQISTLTWLVNCSGWIGAVIFLLSIYFVATVIKLFMEIREPVAAPQAILVEFENYLRERNFRQMYQDMKQSNSFLGNVLAAGMSELPNGLSEARETLDRASDAETIGMEKSISMLAVLGTLGPMIGLLGTLKGMIAAFGQIALSAEQVKANKVADAISQSLVLTFEGVLLSVPAIFFFALFRNRISTLSANITLQADQMLRRLSQAAVWKSTAPNPPASK
jgi:biopolymer transport protein ExbB